MAFKCPQCGFNAETKELSLRQEKIFLLIKEGLSTKQIARKLRRSAKTIEAHRYVIRKKLGLIGTGVQLGVENEQPN